MHLPEAPRFDNPTDIVTALQRPSPREVHPCSGQHPAGEADQASGKQSHPPEYREVQPYCSLSPLHSSHGEGCLKQPMYGQQQSLSCPRAMQCMVLCGGVHA